MTSTKTKVCVLCGKKWKPDKHWKYPCNNCKRKITFDNTTGSVHWKALNPIDKLLNGEFTEGELKLIADSYGFRWLCLKTLPLMTDKAFVGLLKDVMNKTTEKT